MEENRQISPAEEFQVIYVDTLPWRWSVTLLHRCGLHTDLLPETTVRRGNNFTVGKAGRHSLSQVIKDRCRCNNTAQEQVKFHRQMDFLNLENTKIYLRIKREKRRWERFMKTYLAVSSKWFNWAILEFHGGKVWLSTKEKWMCFVKRLETIPAPFPAAEGQRWIEAGKREHFF